MKALRVQVERVVRPVRASSGRKDRMREELLAHLLRLYDEELSRSGNPETATAAAISRFGDAAQLTRELQDSVPAYERWGMTDIAPRGRAKRRVGESPLHYLRAHQCHWPGRRRTAGYGDPAGGAGIRTAWAGAPGRAISFTQALLFMLGVYAIEVVAIFCGVLLSERMRRLMERRETAADPRAKRRLAGHIAACALGGSAIVGLGIAAILSMFDFVVQIPLLPPPFVWGISAVAALIALPFTFQQARCWRRRHPPF